MTLAEQAYHCMFLVACKRQCVFEEEYTHSILADDDVPGGGLVNFGG